MRVFTVLFLGHPVVKIYFLPNVAYQGDCAYDSADNIQLLAD